MLKCSVKYQMWPNKNKPIDWSKPFKIVKSKEHFIKLKQDQPELKNYKFTPPQIIEQEEIIVPKIQTVERISMVKKSGKLQPNYIRLKDSLNLPKQESYELSEVDHVFVQNTAQKFQLEGKVIITKQLMAQIIIQLEKKAGKDTVLQRFKPFLSEYLSSNHKFIGKIPNFEHFTELVFNYWKNRREEVKFPLYRPLWKPTNEIYCYNLAYKKRERPNRNLRRIQKYSENQTYSFLKKQFKIAKNLSKCVLLRQKLKMGYFEVQASKFHEKCQRFFPSPFFLQLQNSIHKVESHHHEFKSLKKKIKKLINNPTQVEEQSQQVQTQNFNENFSIVHFLSNVINSNHSLTQQVNSSNQTSNEVSSNNNVSLQQMEEQDEMINIEEDELLILKQSECSNLKQPKDFFELYERSIGSFYFGQNQFLSEQKNIKKSIAVKFKRFQENQRSKDSYKFD